MNPFSFADKVTFFLPNFGTKKNVVMEMNYLFFIAKRITELTETRKLGSNLEQIKTPFGKIVDEYDKDPKNAEHFPRFYSKNICLITQTVDPLREQILFKHIKSTNNRNDWHAERIDIVMKERTSVDHIPHIIRQLVMPFTHRTIPIECIFRNSSITMLLDNKPHPTAPANRQVKHVPPREDGDQKNNSLK